MGCATTRRALEASGFCLLILTAAPSRAAVQPDPAATALPGVIVAAPSPFLGTGVDSRTSPVGVTLLDAQDLARGGAADVLRALDEQAPGVSLDSASGNPFQPTLVYRGFEASPLQGTAQGLAVYVGGVRFNQPFGDTLNWDLIPSGAIERLTLEGSNPVFGLNALGGALNVQLKSGFTWQGLEAEGSGGSFGQVQGDAQYGVRRGEAGLYLALSGVHQDGWRDRQASDIHSLYGDLGWRHERGEVHLALRLAESDLNGPGSSPVELLAVAPAAQFTAPNTIKNGSAAVSLAVRYALSDATTLQAIAHGDYFRQAVVNGNAPGDTPCDDGSGLLCSDTGPSTTHGGQPIPAFLGPDPLDYAELDRQTTSTVGYGLALQLINADKLFGLSDHLIAGLSFDGAETGFSAVSLIGGITPVSRVFVGPGVVIDEPGQDTPVRLGVRNADYGAFISDTLDLTPGLSITASGRFNRAEIDLSDRNGGDLGGHHRYSRFNPAIGATWRAASWLTLYAGYAEANRAPTPAELSCANPADACSLANFFVGDPDLKQVVAHTVEAGLRGATTPRRGASLTYSLGLYRTDLDDDIAFVNSAVLGRAFFANIGRTRRQGLDAQARWQGRRWRVWASYSRTEATYRTGFVEAGGENPAAGALGELTIRPGDRLPGVPENQVKLGVDMQVTERLGLGATLIGRDRAVLFGDEANLTPKLPGYVVLNLNAGYALTPHLMLFGRIENAGDARYYSYGAFSPTSAVRLVQAPGAGNPRSYSPAAPIGGFGGLRLRF
jgi:outer membrane receptor protein involved in Fe transport